MVYFFLELVLFNWDSEFIQGCLCLLGLAFYLVSIMDSCLGVHVLVGIISLVSTIWSLYFLDSWGVVFLFMGQCRVFLEGF